jgi:hypothetical protein
MTTTDQRPPAAREWPQVSVLRRRLARQLEIRPRDLSPLARQRFDHLVSVRARLDALDQHLREYEAEPGEETAMLAAALLSEAARLALRDLAEQLVAEEESAGATG